MLRRTAFVLVATLGGSACSASHELVRLADGGVDAEPDASPDMDVDAESPALELPTWSAPIADDRVITRLDWTTVYVAYRPAEAAGATTYVSALAAGNDELAAAGTTSLTAEQHAFGSVVELDPAGPFDSRGVHLAMVEHLGERVNLRHVLVADVPRTAEAETVRTNESGPAYLVANMPPPLAVLVETGTVYGVVMPSTVPVNTVVPFSLPVSTSDPGTDVDTLAPQVMSGDERGAVDFAYRLETASVPLVVTRNTVIDPAGPVEYGFWASFPTPQLTTIVGPCGSPSAAVDVARSSMQVGGDTAVAVETCNTVDGRRVARGFAILRETQGDTATLRTEPLVGLDTRRRLLTDLQVATTGSSFLVAAVYGEPLDATHEQVVAELVEYVYDPRTRAIQANDDITRVVLLASSSEDTQTLASFNLHASYELVVLETITSDATTGQARVTLRSLLR